jgi:hypothetical protein
VEEVLDTAFIPDESESLVDQKASDRSRWHTRVLRKAAPRMIPGARQAERWVKGREDAARTFRERRRRTDLPAPRTAPPVDGRTLSLKTGSV